MHMRPSRQPAVAVVFAAAALVLTACNSGSGDNGSSSIVPLPSGVGGVATSAGAHHSAHRTGKSGGPSHAHGSAGQSAAGSTAASTAPGGHHGGGTPTHESSAPHATSSAPGSTAPYVTVTPHSGLGATEVVTVEGFHFTPNMTLVVAECRDVGTNTNLADCNINSVITYSPGARVTSDAHGHVGPLQITVRKTFKSVNCGTERCLVAVSEPAVNPDPHDEGDVYLNFR